MGFVRVFVVYKSSDDWVHIHCDVLGPPTKCGELHHRALMLGYIHGCGSGAPIPPAVQDSKMSKTAFVGMFMANPVLGIIGHGPWPHVFMLLLVVWSDSCCKQHTLSLAVDMWPMNNLQSWPRP